MQRTLIIISLVFAATAVAEETPHWSLQPIRRPAVPQTKNPGWARNPIDRFLLAQLEAKGLRPPPAARRNVWLRRVTFNLTGLPPTPAEIADFLRDQGPNAHSKVVDRLLASPRYGEKWARHWLDVARYADSNGLDENMVYVSAYHYRDYVIESFNRDQPFDVFVRAQVAGDLLPPPRQPADLSAKSWQALKTQIVSDRIRATGFLALGPKGLREVDGTKMELDIIDDQIATVGKAFLALTLECARCHDHKFDPITAADYYSLAGIFKSTRTMKQIIDKRGKGNGFWLERSIVVNNQGSTQPTKSTAMAVSEGRAVNVRVHERGSHLNLGKSIARGFPVVLRQPNMPLAIGPKQSGRLQMASWLTNPRHPLTSRVIVNRIWQWHFGSGPVATPDNFGKLGTPPADPQLLDWLAAEFVVQGWSIKQLSRIILTSSTYRGGVEPAQPMDDERALSLPPSIRVAYAFPRRRLAAEEIRDTLLFVAGTLDSDMFGSLLKLKPRQYVNDSKTGRHLVTYKNRRRSVYQPVIRNKVYGVFRTFDFPNPSLVSGRRSSTTVPPQLLMMMNSKLAIESAEGMFKRISSLKTEVNRIQMAYQVSLGRTADSTEVKLASSFLKQYQRTIPSGTAKQKRQQAWKSFCQALIMSNEFIYVE